MLWHCIVRRWRFVIVCSNEDQGFCQIHLLGLRNRFRQIQAFLENMSEYTSNINSVPGSTMPQDSASTPTLAISSKVAIYKQMMHFLDFEIEIRLNRILRRRTLQCPEGHHSRRLRILWAPQHLSLWGSRSIARWFERSIPLCTKPMSAQLKKKVEKPLGGVQTYIYSQRIEFTESPILPILVRRNRQGESREKKSESFSERFGVKGWGFEV
jgi:hypothetical protein